MSASVNLSSHHKVHKFSFGTGSPGWSQQKGREMVVVVVLASLSWRYTLRLKKRPIFGLL